MWYGSLNNLDLNSHTNFNENNVIDYNKAILINDINQIDGTSMINETLMTNDVHTR